jgi:hypothetical protein
MNNNIRRCNENPIVQSERISVFVNFDSKEVWREIYREYQEQVNFKVVKEISFQYMAKSNPKFLGTKRPAPEATTNNSAQYVIDKKKGTIRIIIQKSLLIKKASNYVRGIKKQINQVKPKQAVTNTPIDYGCGLFEDLAIDPGIQINRKEDVVYQKKFSVISF